MIIVTVIIVVINRLSTTHPSALKYTRSELLVKCTSCATLLSAEDKPMFVGGGAFIQ